MLQADTRLCLRCFSCHHRRLPRHTDANVVRADINMCYHKDEPILCERFFNEDGCATKPVCSCLMVLSNIAPATTSLPEAHERHRLSIAFSAYCVVEGIVIIIIIACRTCSHGALTARLLLSRPAEMQVGTEREPLPERDRRPYLQ